MSINVDLKDLQSYEAQCRSWWMERALHFEKTIISETSHDRMTVVRRVGLDAMKQWDAEHPFPKLLPSV